MNSSSLFKQISWYIISKALVIAIGFISIPIFTYLMSVKEYGSFSLILAWVSIFTPIMGLGLNLSFGRAKIEFENSYPEYIFNVIFIVFSFGFLIFWCHFFFEDIIDDYIYNVQWGCAENINLIIALSTASSLISCILSYEQFNYKYKFNASISFLRPVCIVVLPVFLILTIYKERVFSGRLHGYLISEFFILILLFTRFFFLTKDKLNINWKKIKFGISYSFPLVLASLSYVINSQFDRILLGSLDSKMATGIYSFSYSIGNMIFIFAVAVRQAINPWVYQHFDKDKTNISILYDKLNKLFFLSVSLCLLVSYELIDLLSSSEYESSKTILPILFVASFIQVLILNEQETIMFFKKTRVSSLIIFLGSIFNIITNIIYIPKYGIQAASITTLSTYLFIFFACFFYNKNKVNLIFISFFQYIKLICMVGLVLFISIYFEDQYYIRYLLSLCVLALLFIEVKQGVNIFKKLR